MTREYSYNDADRPRWGVDADRSLTLRDDGHSDADAAGDAVGRLRIDWQQGPVRADFFATAAAGISHLRRLALKHAVLVTAGPSGRAGRGGIRSGR